MSTMTLILDRIEGDMGVFEGLGAIPLALLPEAIREGAVLHLQRTSSQVLMALDPALEAGLAEQARALQQQALEVGGVSPVGGGAEPIAL